MEQGSSYINKGTEVTIFALSQFLFDFACVPLTTPLNISAWHRISFITEMITVVEDGEGLFF